MHGHQRIKRCGRIGHPRNCAVSTGEDRVAILDQCGCCAPPNGQVPSVNRANPRLPVEANFLES